MDVFKEMDRRDAMRFICVLFISVLMPHSAESKESSGKLLENEDRGLLYQVHQGRYGL